VTSIFGRPRAEIEIVYDDKREGQPSYAPPSVERNRLHKPLIQAFGIIGVGGKSGGIETERREIFCRRAEGDSQSSHEKAKPLDQNRHTGPKHLRGGTGYGIAQAFIRIGNFITSF
jgi:hypothetical protein